MWSPTTLPPHHVTQLQDQAIFIKTSSSGPSQQAALESALSQYPNLKVQTAAQYKADQKKQFGTLLNLVYVLLAFSILIASFGVVNTMALSVIERTREIGLLRSIGMGRRQVRAMIRGEAVVVALIGALLGLVARHRPGRRHRPCRSQLRESPSLRSRCRPWWSSSSWRP